VKKAMAKNTNKKENKRDRIKTKGVVIEGFRSALFSVKLNLENKDTEVIVQCTLCGKMKQHYIKVVPGDKVEVELCEYDMTKGRIVSRSS